MANAAVWTEPERRRVAALCARITGDRDAAEDLAQETLLEAWRNRHKLHDPSGADRWVSAIARNVCLRWARRRGQELPLVDLNEAVDAVEVELEASELEELLDRALSLLPPETRDVLVHHYVQDSPHAEIAARLGISEAAVSMRVSRGRVVLQRLMQAEEAPAEGGWTDTRVWCTACGTRRLQMQRRPDAVLFQCPECSRHPSAVYDLTNPAFAAIVGDLVRPAPILKRAYRWSVDYFAEGAGAAACTQCREPIELVHHVNGKHDGLRGRCGSCDREVWTAVTGLAHAQPGVRELGRARTHTPRDVGYDGVDATLVRIASVTRSDAVDVLFERDTLRVLAVR